MFDKFRERSNDLEHIDVGDYTPEEYEGCIIELQRVNHWLGDARALRRSLLADIEETNLRRVSVLDVAAGSGELLRVAAAWTRKKKREGSFTALELNARSARAVLENARGRDEIFSIRGDALSLPFAAGSFDYAISSLFTHHLNDLEAVQALQELNRVARRRIFIIDLHRHPIAYYLYRTVGRLFLHNRLLREDGALSILRSFKPDELIDLAARAGLNDIRLDRRFPYRLVLSARATSLDPQDGRSVRNNKQPNLTSHPEHLDHAENVRLAR